MRVTTAMRAGLAEILHGAFRLLYRAERAAALTVIAPDAAAADAALPLTQTEDLSLRAFADLKAGHVMDGINAIIDRTLTGLPPAASAADRQAALATAKRAVNAYHTQWMEPYLESFTRHRALIDTYEKTVMPNGKTAADAHLWLWEQTTDFEDDCRQAAALGPSSLNTIYAITGGPPPQHPNCQCSLYPVV